MSDVVEPAHIAVLIPNLLGGGAERYAVNISRELSRRAHRVDLVVGHPRGPLLEDVADGVRLVGLGHAHNSANFLKLARYLRREQPHALLAAQPGANIIAVLAQRLTGVATRIVVSQHTNLMATQQHGIVGIRPVVLDRLSRWTYPRAHGLVAVSHGVAEGLTDVYGISPESITVIYNPVITRELIERFDAEPDQAMDRLIGWDTRPLVIAVGRLTHEKGFDKLIEAFSKVRASQPARLIILGEGPDRRALEGLVESFDLTEDVQMPGHLKNPLPLLKRASAYVLSSRFEGLPTVLIEALYAGVPIVATDCPSGPSEILANGEHGLLTPVDEVTSLAAGIEQALTGGVPVPGPSSWRPFEGDRVAAEYERILLGERSGA